MKKVLTIDRGNNSVKGALFESGRITKRWNAEGAVEEIAVWAAESKPDGAAVSSVIREWNDLCVSALSDKGIGRIVIAGHDSPWPFTLDIDSPASVGPDRLCAAAAVAAPGVGDAVIIDAGTAVTVDILSGGKFAGGAIMPGLELMLRSLSDGTSALPVVRIDKDDNGKSDVLPGRDTESAIRVGVLSAWRGGAADLVRLSLERFEITPPVFLTGGDAGLIVDTISPAPRLYPDLVLQGLNWVYNRQFG